MPPPPLNTFAPEPPSIVSPAEPPKASLVFGSMKSPSPAAPLVRWRLAMSTVTGVVRWL